MSTERRLSFLDQICIRFDEALRTITNHPHVSGTPYPADSVKDTELTSLEKKHSAALMRINHAGEICAQALYHGQGIVSRSVEIKEKLQHAAIEEGDHLSWCKMRLDELESRPSLLNPLWYAGSFCIGAFAGLISDKWSLGFLVETERQVIKHLENHLQTLPENDKRSYCILEKMEQDEAKHRDEALALGAKELPQFIKLSMSFVSRIMVKTAYFI